MLPDTPHLIQIRNNESSWMALSLAIPTYLIVLIGTSSFLQGVFYLVYLIGLLFIWKNRTRQYISIQFVLTSFVFLIAWIAPNMMTYSSGRLESSMLSLPVLFYHVVVLTIILLWQRSWTLNVNSPKKSIQELSRTLLILVTPLVILIIIESVRLKIIFPMERPNPFQYRHLNGEVFLMFVLVAMGMSRWWVKWAAIVTAAVGLILIQNRGGLLSLGIIVVLYGLGYVYKRLTICKLLSAFLVLGLATFIFYQQLYRLFDIFFLLDDTSRGLGSGFTGRMPVWIEAWHEIQRVPWTGVGFWVSPFPFYSVSPDTAVHNAFLRIWVENGTVLFLLIIGILTVSAIQIERKKLNWHRLGFYSILVYYFFLPRHLTLNPLSIMLYLIIMQALCLPWKRNKT